MIGRPERLPRARRGAGQRHPDPRPRFRRHPSRQHRARDRGLPALRPLASVSPCGVHGRDLLVAYAAGMETAIRIGAAVKGGFHHAGFHATGLVAHFSSAVVAAQAARPRRGQHRRGAGHRGEHRLRRAGLPGGGRVDQALPPRLGRRRRHHRGAARAARLQGPVASLRRPLRPLRHASAGSRRRGRSGRRSNRPRRDWDLADTAHQALSGLPFHPRLRRCGDRAAAARSTCARSPAWRRSCPATPCRSSPSRPPPRSRPTTEYEAKFSAQFVVATCLIKGASACADLHAGGADRSGRAATLRERVRCAVDPEPPSRPISPAASASRSRTAASSSDTSASTAAPASGRWTRPPYPENFSPLLPCRFRSLRPSAFATPCSGWKPIPQPRSPRCCDPLHHIGRENHEYL